MAILASNTPADTDSEQIAIDPSETTTSNFVADLPGTITSLKLKLEAFGESGGWPSVTLTARLVNMSDGGAEIVRGTFDCSAIPDLPTSAALYEVTVDTPASIPLGASLRILAKVSDENNPDPPFTAQVVLWRGDGVFDHILEVHGTELTAPTKATNPAPANANASVTLDQATVTWDDGGGADTYNIYYGTSSGSLSFVSSAQAGTSFTVTGITDGSPYAYLSTRYWRIDSTNDAGTTTGDEWSFTTIRFSAPTTTYFYQGQYYRLLIQSDGSYGDVPGVGVEGTDYEFLAAGYEANFVDTVRKLVSAANNKVWYEDI